MHVAFSQPKDDQSKEGQAMAGASPRDEVKARGKMVSKHGDGIALCSANGCYLLLSYWLSLELEQLMFRA